MLQKNKNPIEVSASETLKEASTDFILSRKAMLCSKRTVEWYRWTLGKILDWMEEDGATLPGEMNSQRMRSYLSSLAERGLSDTYIHSHARVARTFIKFMIEEDYTDKVVKFNMPALAQKRLRCLTAEEVADLIKAAVTPRDKALVMFMVDTGIRREELCNLNWGHVDLDVGVVRIDHGKGGKARTVVAGNTTRRALLRYKRTVTSDDDKPLFQTELGGRFALNSLNSFCARLSKTSGIKVSPHALRRTFATMSLKAGMNLMYLQGLMGHATIEMTRRYIQMLDEDLVTAHEGHGPVDTYLRSL